MNPTKIGNLHLPNFIYNAAGVWDTTFDQYNELTSRDYCGAFVTKSMTLAARSGNEYPKYHFSNPGYSINSNGLENLGLYTYLEFARSAHHKPFFFSVGGFSDTERIEMLQTIQNGSLGNIGIELNMSCPNVGSAGPAYSAQTLQDSLNAIFTSIGKPHCTFGLKLPPYFLQSEITAITNVIKNVQYIDFITCINSVPNAIDYDIDNDLPCITPNDGYGGLGGKAILPIGLSNVSRFKREFDKNGMSCQIIGCGGVATGADVYKYMLAGASAVQVGTTLWREGPDCFQRINNELETILQRRGVNRVL